MTSHRQVGLSQRLIVLGMLAIVLVNGVGGWLLRWQLHDAVMRSVHNVISDRADRIAAGLSRTRNGTVMLDHRLVHDEFRSIFSGWYWQLEGLSNIERSRSLWDSTLKTAAAKPLDEVRGLNRLTGPRGELLQGIVREVTLGEQVLQLHVYGPGDGTRAELARLDRIMLMMLVGLSLALLLATCLQVKLGLRPLKRLHDALRRVHDGDDSRVGTGYGPDLDPLASEIDEVLERNARVVDRSRSYAADLSHALKKPLALLSADAQRTAPDAALVRKQVDSMYQLIERHLARAGSGAGDRRRIDVAETLKGLVALMKKLHARRNLDWQLEVPSQLCWRGEQTDLEEMLGNLLDNAGKWARTRVRVEACLLDASDPSCDAMPGRAGMLEIRICDDGEGLDEDEIARARRRGQRFDESTEGSGLGLAIACDIAETYDGQIDLGRCEMGGLNVVLRLPR